ncbi:hypothetical protein SRABI96_04855 [Peribacillus sp. Bi96]|nr:hypothetical protein SRABI96_04855 [Peribacillus sp. Bi96]
MNITDLLILSVVIGLINGFKDKNFKTKSFCTRILNLIDTVVM